jgi:hypothetical protein
MLISIAWVYWLFFYANIVIKNHETVSNCCIIILIVYFPPFLLLKLPTNLNPLLKPIIFFLSFSIQEDRGDGSNGLFSLAHKNRPY